MYLGVGTGYFSADTASGVGGVDRGWGTMQAIVSTRTHLLKYLKYKLLPPGILKDTI